MTLTFETLTDELHLTSNYEQEAQLNALSEWCFDHVSRDIRYTGLKEEQYKQYYSLAAHYLNNFLAHLAPNPAANRTPFNQMTALQYAAQNGYDHYIMNQSNLIESELNNWDEEKMTPLHHSATKGYVYTVDALLARGANAEIRNGENQFPLFCALFVPLFHAEDFISRKFIIFRQLLKNAPQVLPETDKAGDTVLQLIASNGFCELIPDIQVLNSNLAFIPNHLGHYPIHTAILNGQLEMAALLLEQKNVALLTDARKRTPLHYAASYGETNMVELCCRKTPDINVRDTANKTPLLYAAEAQNQDALIVLLQQGADAMLTDYRGFSILNFAIEKQNIPMVHWILENGPAELINQIDAEGHRPLDQIQKLDNTALKQLLVSKGAIKSECQ